MRQGTWIEQLNVTILPATDRPGAAPTPPDTAYVVKDIFTTRDGSWEAPDPEMGGIEQWARDTYLKPWGAPDYADDFGADHHILVRLEDKDGNPILDRKLVFWTDGVEQLADSTYDGYMYETPKPKSGWANVVMYPSSKYSPGDGESGAFSVMVDGKSEVIHGMGMPDNRHISFFLVFQEADADAEIDVPEVPDYPEGLDGVRQAAWDSVGVRLNRESAFFRYAQDNGLGSPLSNEFDIGTYRAQGFTGAIVYAEIGDWENTKTLAW